MRSTSFLGFLAFGSQVGGWVGSLLILAGVAAPLAASAAPDLIVKDIQLDPASPNAGSGQLTLTFKNIGSSDVDLGVFNETNWTVAIDGQNCENSGIYFDLKAGEETTETTSACTPSAPGEHTITVVVDSDGDVGESDETNNTLTKTFTWSGPDLIVKSISLDPASPNVTEGTVHIVFENIGPYDVDTAILDKTNYTVALDGAACDSGWIFDLNAGSTNDESTSKCAANTPGPHTITVMIDSDKQVAEINEDNNTRTETFIWTGGPDLIIEDIALDPATPKYGDGTLTATVKNQGNVGTGILVNINIKMFLNGEECDTGLVIAGLGAGSTATESTGSCNPTAPGEYTIRFEVDTDDDVIEADESNNFLEKTFFWTAPDLVITDITHNQDLLEPGKSVTFSATVKNQGPVDTDLFVNINLTMFLDGAECDTGLIIAGLNADKTATEDTSSCIPDTPGPHTIRFDVDTDEDVPELDETNNSFEKEFVWCGGDELCNGVDDDCDGETDEGFGVGESCDGDDADLCENGVKACGDGPDSGAGADMVCVEEGAAIVELCNGIDDDCDGSVDEDFAQLGTDCASSDGTCATGSWACGPDGGVVCVAKPQDEVCNGKDDDCDGETDEDFKAVLGAPCAVGAGICRTIGIMACDDQGGVSCDAVAGEPAPQEVCGNDLDDDCDGLAEESCGCSDDEFVPCGVDIGSCQSGWLSCVAGSFTETCEGALGPQEEVCNTLDDDCDGSIDEGCPCVASRPCGEDAGACSGGKQWCVGGTWTACIGDAPTEEGCAGQDEDCDGHVNAGCTCNEGEAVACEGTPGDCGSYERTCTGGFFGPCVAVEGTCGGGGDTGGSTGGDTGGSTGGDTGGDTGGSTGGDTGGSTGGDTGGSTGGDTGTGTDTGGGTGGDTGTGTDTGGGTGGDTGGDTGGGAGTDTGGDTGTAGGGDTTGQAAPAIPLAEEPSGCQASGAPTQGAAPWLVGGVMLLLLGLRRRDA